MKALIILLILVFAIAPAGLILALGMRRRFENEVFGRIYVWDKPWVLVTQDAFVKQRYETLQRRVIWLGGFLVVVLMAVILIVL
jgi:CHASE1-domain containing sensor protein